MKNKENKAFKESFKKVETVKKLSGNFQYFWLDLFYRLFYDQNKSASDVCRHFVTIYGNGKPVLLVSLVVFLLCCAVQNFRVRNVLVQADLEFCVKR